MSENQNIEKKKRTKIHGKRLMGRIIALLMVIMMLLATASTLIFYIIYK